MKKIILLLALALGVEVKGQIVGGFMPQNSTKSFTAGNSTFSNVIARGTLSVGSTATVTGGLKVTGASTIGLGQNNYLGSIVSSQLESTGNGYIGNKLSIGSNVSPTATLDVTGDAKVSSTFSLGSANLTGGNTGTVAVLSDAVFPVNLIAGATSPADGSTQYIGSSGYVWANSAASGTVSLPYNCTLVGWQFNSVNSVGNGSSETSTISIMANGSESLVLSTSINFSLASGYNNFSGSGLSTNFSAGDKVNLKIINPTWATNPQGIVTGVVFWFVRRS